MQPDCHSTSPPHQRNGDGVDMRQLRALEIAARAKLNYASGVWTVPSQTSPGTSYQVTLDEALSCECEDFALRREACKHILAARIVLARDGKGTSPVVIGPGDTVPKRPTYKQDWPVYNKAQMQEKHRFQVLLVDLVRPVPELPYVGFGRRRVPIADVLFACAFKVYSTVSARRFACDLKDAHDRGHISFLPHPNKIHCYLEMEELTPTLTGLIRQSALPLRAVETSFAPDSTGFSTSRFVRWFDEKYSVERSGHDWVKAHIMCGVKTHIVTAVEIKGREANDSPLLPSMLQTTKDGGFTVLEVPADKGYLAASNIEAVHEAGATPYIPFKSNSTGGSGGLWEKAFHYYCFNREEFLKHYHLRSNAETVFSMIKAKFRDHIRSRTDTAMKNEALCKVLCHDICCLIMSQAELGIEPVFWQGQPAQTAEPAILRFPAI